MGFDGKTRFLDLIGEKCRRGGGLSALRRKGEEVKGFDDSNFLETRPRR